MIAMTANVSSASIKDFSDRLTQVINTMQEEGLIVEVQYMPMNTKGEYEYIVYTALLIGRMKGGKENDMARCEECKANKICDHNRFGFENCGNFIPVDVVPESEVNRLKEILNAYALQYGTVTRQQKVIDEARAEGARDFAKFLIDKSRGCEISVCDLPDFEIAFNENHGT